MGKQTSLVPVQTIEQHANIIKSAMAKSIEGFINVGQAVLAAKGELDETEFSSLFDKESKNYVGMAERQGYRFLAIANNGPKLLKFQENLPADVTQLDAISRMNIKDIKAAIKAEVMSPSMSRGDIKKWENSLNQPDPAQTKIPVQDGEPTDDDLRDIENEIQDAVIVEYADETKSPLRIATEVVLKDTPEEDRVAVIKGFMKKWKVSLTDLT